MHSYNPYILYYHAKERLLIAMPVHVDDSMVSGKNDDLANFNAKGMQDIQYHVILGKLSLYLGVKYK